MTESADAATEFGFVGGSLCLDFVNTVGGSREVVRYEFLHKYEDLLSWALQANIISENERQSLAIVGAGEPLLTQEVLHRAIALREAIYRIFYRLAQSAQPDQQDVDILNKELAGVLSHARLAREGDAFVWRWDTGVADLDRPLWPIARSAADLLTVETMVSRVRHCEGDTCGWLFLDQTKNHSRRWCTMKDCGNRAKVRRHRARKKASI